VASVSGNRIQWVGADRRRRGLRLGNLKPAALRVVCTHVDELVRAAKLGVSPAETTVKWVANISDGLHEKLVHAGLTGPRAQATTLSAFVDQFLASALHLKERTKLNIRGTRKRMVVFFGDVELKSITPEKAEDWLASMRDASYADATIGRNLKRAKQLFRRAVKRGVVNSNPFDGIKGLKDTNDARNEYVTRATVASCIKTAPDYEWRLILGLSRYAALRIPSESLALKWADVDWAQRRLIVDSPKTGLRVIPIDPDLYPLLLEASERADDGTVHVIAKHRGENLRTEMMRIVKRAGFNPWPRLFHNMRAACERDWSDRFPMPTVCAWTGHDARTAQKHYLKTVADEHYEAASSAGAFLAHSGAFLEQKCDESSYKELQQTLDNLGAYAISQGSEQEGQYPRQESNL
jgi:integrase